MAILPDRTELTTPADGDLYVTTDVSDTTDAATGTDKKITWASIKTALETYFDTLYATALGADDNYVTDAEKIVIGNTSGTNTGDNAVNSNYSSLVTNATHTGEVTGSGALTLDKTALSNRTDTVITASDVILFGDATDTGNLKKDTVQGILDLMPGGGNVSKVGTPVDNQVGVWTGDGTIEGDTGLTFDTTTNVLAVNSSTANYPLVLERISDTSIGTFIKTKQTTASPAALDYIGGVDLYSSDSAANEQAYAFFNAKIISPTSGAEYGSFVIETVQNGAIGGVGEQMLEVGAESDSAINGISVGFNTAAGIVSSRGDQDIILRTGNATTGNITIVDGADGQIQLNPNGTGTIKLGTLTGVLRADTGVVSVDTDVTDLVSAASDTVAGKVELATTAETNTGTSTTLAVTPDGLAGSNLGIRYVQATLNGTTALTTSEKVYFRIPAALNGMNLVSVAATVGTGASGSSSSGTPTFTVKNVTDSNQMLSTSLTVDASEYTSATAATAAVIDTTKDDVVTDDLIEVAVTTAGTGVTYCTITMGFQTP